jgi:hypothetical protein
VGLVNKSHIQTDAAARIRKEPLNTFFNAIPRLKNEVPDEV